MRSTRRIERFSRFRTPRGPITKRAFRPGRAAGARSDVACPCGRSAYAGWTASAVGGSPAACTGGSATVAACLRSSNATSSGPDPRNPYPEATAALGLPLLGHLDPEFLRIMDETCDRLRHGLGHQQRADAAAERHRLGGHGGGVRQHRLRARRRRGRGAVNGLFGQRMCDVAAALRRRGGPGRARVGHAGRPAAGRRRRTRARRCIAAVHAETSTGVRSDIAALGAAARATRCWSPTRSPRSAASSCAPTTGASTSATPAPRSAWAWRPAWRRSRSTTAPSSAGSRSRSSWYLDLGLLGGYVGEAAGSGGRTYHHTAPIAMVASLHAGLGRILDEGLERRRGPGTRRPAGCSRTGWRRWAWSSSRRRAPGCPS